MCLINLSVVAQLELFEVSQIIFQRIILYFIHLILVFSLEFSELQNLQVLPNMLLLLLLLKLRVRQSNPNYIIITTLCFVREKDSNHDLYKFISHPVGKILIYYLYKLMLGHQTFDFHPSVHNQLMDFY